MPYAPNSMHYFFFAHLLLQESVFYLIVLGHLFFLQINYQVANDDVAELCVYVLTMVVSHIWPPSSSLTLWWWWRRSGSSDAFLIAAVLLKTRMNVLSKKTKHPLIYGINVCHQSAIGDDVLRLVYLRHVLYLPLYTQPNSCVNLRITNTTLLHCTLELILLHYEDPIHRGRTWCAPHTYYASWSKIQSIAFIDLKT